jgi:DNA-binding PadR family transcriptional regulator
VKELTTTSFALLGLLALKPWSAYELAQQMQRGFAWYWPRAERAIYDEPKNLVRHGMARSSTAYRGRQKRTLYEITPAGRRAFGRWLAGPSALPRVESEAMVRLTFSEFASDADAQRAIASLTEAAESIEEVVRTVSGEYLAGRGPFPDRLPQVVLAGRFLVEMAAMYRRYAAWATRMVAGEEEPTEALRALHAAAAPRRVDRD